MERLETPALANAPKNKGGRPRGSMTFNKKSFLELARKNPREAFENLRKLALYDENSFVRVAATKIWIEYAAGKPPEGEGSGSAVTQVNVITGVRDAAGEVRYGPVGKGEFWQPETPPHGPLLPDGRDPFETHGAKPTPRAPVLEPVQHKLYEGEPE